MKFAGVLAVFLALICPAAADQSDADVIASTLHGMFDKLGLTLKIEPVAVSGNHAVADWAQAEMGGRALLRRKDGDWALVLCAGDQIKAASAMVQAGVPQADATRLSESLAAAEAKLDPKDVAMFSKFEGLVMMDARSQQHH